MEVNHFQIPLLAPRDGKSDTWDRANDTDREMRVRRALLKTPLHLADIFGRNAAICLLLREFICFGMALLYKEERAPERERFVHGYGSLEDFVQKGLRRVIRFTTSSAIHIGRKCQ